MGHDQLATKKLQFNEQLSWLVRILTGGTEQVQEDSLASSLGRLIEPPEAAADFALWQHPAIRPAARKLCRSFRIDPEELTEVRSSWKVQFAMAMCTFVPTIPSIGPGMPFWLLELNSCETCLERNQKKPYTISCCISLLSICFYMLSLSGKTL